MNSEETTKGEFSTHSWSLWRRWWAEDQEEETSRTTAFPLHFTLSTRSVMDSAELEQYEVSYYESDSNRDLS